MADKINPEANVEIAKCSGVKPTNISASLDDLFNGLKEENVKHRRCGGGNSLQVVTSPNRLRESEK